MRSSPEVPDDDKDIPYIVRHRTPKAELTIQCSSGTSVYVHSMNDLLDQDDTETWN